MTFKVYTYPKFGDLCICYGIIKEFAKQYEKVDCYSDVIDLNTFNTNKRLYTSLKNVELRPELYDKEKINANHCIAHTKYWLDTIQPWFDDRSMLPPKWYNITWMFDRQWYLNAEVSFNLKWDNFFFERDLNKEKEVFYDIIGLKDNEEFIFLHEDPSRDYNIKREYINPNIRLIEFFKLSSVNILDILYTVEKAKEVHTFNTGTLTFIDLMNIKHKKLYYHKYLRPWIFEQPTLRLNWITIEK
jgi:hypothetical protein